MALPILASSKFTCNKMLLLEKRPLSLAVWNFNLPRATKCKATYVSNDHSQKIRRQSSIFQPSIWTDDYIQSLNSEYKVELFCPRELNSVGRVIAYRNGANFFVEGAKITYVLFLESFLVNIDIT